MQEKAQEPLEEEPQRQKDEALLNYTRRMHRLSSQFSVGEMSFAIRHWLQKEDHR